MGKFLEIAGEHCLILEDEAVREWAAAVDAQKPYVHSTQTLKPTIYDSEYYQLALLHTRHSAVQDSPNAVAYVPLDVDSLVPLSYPR